MSKDKLIDSLVSTINKKHKGAKVAHLLGLAGEEAATNVKDWISTGSSLLDLAIANRKNGGIATGRVTELMGMEAAGKSLIGSHILAETQRKGGIAVYIDTESAVSIDFLKVIGVDVDKLVYIQMDTVEDIYETIEDLIIKIRESDKNKLVTILIDSMSAASTKMEMEADYTRDGWSTGKAILNSKAMRKITNMIANHRIALIITNQLRIKLGVMFGDNTTTAGGLAIGFHSSTRIKLNKATKIKDKDGEIIGLFIRAQITKSRFGPSMRNVTFPLYFNSGIDDVGSWLQYLRDKKLVKSGGAWNTLEKIDKETGEISEVKFQAKNWASVLSENNNELRDYVYNLICDNFIMEYIMGADVADIDSIDITEDEVTDA